MREGGEGGREGGRKGGNKDSGLAISLSLPYSFWLEERVWGPETSFLLRRHCIRVGKCKGQNLTIEITCTTCVTY